MKDHANLIDAAAKLVSDYSNVHFVLVDPNVDNQNPALSNQIKRLGITKRGIQDANLSFFTDALISARLASDKVTLLNETSVTI